MCGKDSATLNNVHASFNNKDWTLLDYLNLNLGSSLKEYKLHCSCKLLDLNSTNEDEPRVLISPLLEKKRQNLKFARFLKGAMVIAKICNRTRHGRHQICKKFPRNGIEETSMAIDRLFATR
jgi:hypothetical protein